MIRALLLCTVVLALCAPCDSGRMEISLDAVERPEGGTALSTMIFWRPSSGGAAPAAAAVGGNNGDADRRAEDDAGTLASRSSSSSLSAAIDAGAGIPAGFPGLAMCKLCLNMTYLEGTRCVPTPSRAPGVGDSPSPRAPPNSVVLSLHFPP